MAVTLTPEHSGEHLSKLLLPRCPEQPWLKAHAGQDGGQSAHSTEDRLLPRNTPILRREIPHISFPALKDGQSSATCKQCQIQLGFYTGKCKYRKSMYTKALKKIPQTSLTTWWGMPTFYFCRTLIHL